MGRRFLLLGLLGLVGGLGAVSGGSAAPRPAAGWGHALEVPGSASLNSGGDAEVDSLSCTTPGNCTGGGTYVDGTGGNQAFVVDESNDDWGDAIEVPGSAGLNSGGIAVVNSVSCATAGNCAAGGSYADGSGHDQVFVASETNGVWGDAIEVPGSAVLNSGGDAGVYSVSCAAAGECSAGGYYLDGSDREHPFVADETHGNWGNATKVPVPRSWPLNRGGDAAVSSVSCVTVGNCTAGGLYTGASSHSKAFVVSETNGVWGDPIEVPRSATLNRGRNAAVFSVSCGTARNCAAGGYYTDRSGHWQAFVVSKGHGGWRNAIEVPRSATLNSGHNALVTSVSCASAGNCVAGGSYRNYSGHHQAFVVTERHGTWGNARRVPGSATLNRGGNATLNSVSCTTPGNCTAGGRYKDGSGHYQAYVVDERDGAWRHAIKVPGSAMLNGGGEAGVLSVSCGMAGNCSAGGYYTDGSGHQQAFVVGSTTP